MAKVNEQIEAILKLMDQSADLHNQAWLKLETLRKEISGTLYNKEDYEEEELEMMSEDQVASEMLKMKQSEHKVVPFMTDEFVKEYLDDTSFEYKCQLGRKEIEHK
jgi:hypothetical protein